MQFGTAPAGIPTAGVPSGSSCPPGPPHPPPVPGVPPSPPPLPSMSGCASMPGVPPPPPPPFGAPPPPPPPGGFMSSPTRHVLPFGLQPKKEFKPETIMKRLNWSKVTTLFSKC